MSSARSTRRRGTAWMWTARDSSTSARTPSGNTTRRRAKWLRKSLAFRRPKTADLPEVAAQRHAFLDVEALARFLDSLGAEAAVPVKGPHAEGTHRRFARNIRQRHR